MQWERKHSVEKGIPIRDFHTINLAFPSPRLGNFLHLRASFCWSDDIRNEGREWERSEVNWNLRPQVTMKPHRRHHLHSGAGVVGLLQRSGTKPPHLPILVSPLKMRKSETNGKICDYFPKNSPRPLFSTLSYLYVGPGQFSWMGMDEKMTMGMRNKAERRLSFKNTTNKLQVHINVPKASSFRNCKKKLRLSKTLMFKLLFMIIGLTTSLFLCEKKPMLIFANA